MGAELGRPQPIAGHQAWLTSRSAATDDREVGTPAGSAKGHPGGPTCRTLGASWVVEATVNTSMSTSYQMLACIRGPDISRSVNTVMAMLNSLELGRTPVR
jgi:hypothetical protein